MIKEREKLSITTEEAINLAYGDYDPAKYEVVSNKIVSTSRWSNISEIIIQTISDGRFWRDTYSKGATEQQDEGPYEYGEPNFKEVFPEKVEVTVYK